MEKKYWIFLLVGVIGSFIGALINAKKKIHESEEKSEEIANALRMFVVGLDSETSQFVIEMEKKFHLQCPHDYNNPAQRPLAEQYYKGLYDEIGHHATMLLSKLTNQELDSYYENILRDYLHDESPAPYIKKTEAFIDFYKELRNVVLKDLERFTG